MAKRSVDIVTRIFPVYPFGTIGTVKAIETMNDETRGNLFSERLSQAKSTGRPLLMGIVNVTPDSFSDGGLFLNSDEAVIHGHTLISDGADIVDIGGESTRPGAPRVSEMEELERTMPVIERLSSERGALISIDTVKTGVAERALTAGAAIINDVQGLQGNRDLAGVAADHRAGVVIMHNPGLTGSSTGTSGDPVDACLRYFETSLEIAGSAGISSDRIVLDPGFGFGKSLDQNLALLARFSELCALGLPLLAGTSRKSFIGRLLDRKVDERLAGTLTSGIIAVMAGAAILRVHDVAEHADALNMMAAVGEAGRETVQ